MKTMLTGAGLGLRRQLIPSLLSNHGDSPQPDFLEITPENWMQMGGKRQQELNQCHQRYPLICHGLTLSIGGPAPLDWSFLKNLKSFLDTYQIEHYSEHLSYSSDQGQLYDLLPIPFTAEAVKYVAKRINQVQDYLERPLILENVSFYWSAYQDLTELEFINAVMKESNCQLLLDVNNVYVNSVNHQYDPHDFIQNLLCDSIAYIHIAGHHQEAHDLIIDTHGAEVITPVWDLLTAAYQRYGVVPTLLERDFNIPPLDELLLEVNTIKRIQTQSKQKENAFTDA